ncbi:MAG: PEP-CTERM sorting domain-containing protein, partial [Verrucomicrobiales bacterium]
VNTFQYDSYYVLGADHQAGWTGDTDAYSWDHPNLASANPDLGNQTGWTHLTRWVAFTLTEPVQLTIRIEQTDGVMIPDQNNPGELIGAGADLVPAFTLWSGFEADAEDGSLGLGDPSGGHRWDNDGNETFWADVLDYRSHDGNLGNGAFVEQTLFLPAGDYTMNIAGAKDGAFDPSGGLRQGFAATLTTIPEPSALALLGVCAIGFLNRRRRA